MQLYKNKMLNYNRFPKEHFKTKLSCAVEHIQALKLYIYLIYNKVPEIL